jgi:acyl-coenzyme A thioesterase PaaI-like protein
MVEVGKESIWKNGMELSYWYPDTFVSGSQNKNGMKMKAFFQDSKVVTRYTFDKQFQGGPGVVHGGILSAAVDDLMGYAAIIHKRACVTAKLEVNYILPVQIEKEFIIEAWISGIDGKKIYAESIIFDEETIHTETNAMFIDLGERASEVFKQSQDTKNQLFEYKEETQYP